MYFELGMLFNSYLITCVLVIGLTHDVFVILFVPGW